MGKRCTTNDGDKVRKWYHKRGGQGAQLVQVMAIRCPSGVINDGDKVHKSLFLGCGV